MKDINGNEINVGDEVMVIEHENNFHCGETGKVIGFINGSVNVENDLSDCAYFEIESEYLIKL